MNGMTKMGFLSPDFHPKRTSPKLKACAFHADCCCDVIVGHDVLCAFGTQLDFEEGHLVCDGVSVPMHEFPIDASEVTPIEHLLQDYLDSNEENDEDGPSFDDNFASETLDNLHEADELQNHALISCQSNKKNSLNSCPSLMFFSMTSSRPLQTRKSILKLIHLLHLTILMLAQFLILIR